MYSFETTLMELNRSSWLSEKTSPAKTEFVMNWYHSSVPPLSCSCKIRYRHAVRFLLSKMFQIIILLTLFSIDAGRGVAAPVAVVSALVFSNRSLQSGCVFNESASPSDFLKL